MKLIDLSNAVTQVLPLMPNSTVYVSLLGILVPVREVDVSKNGLVVLRHETLTDEQRSNLIMALAGKTAIDWLTRARE